MPPEPHIRRRRAPWRAAAVLALGLALGTSTAAAQVLPTTSTTEAPAEEEPTTTTTEAPVLPTTTEAPPETTTTQRSTATTRPTATTDAADDEVVDDGDAEDEVVEDGDGTEADATDEEEVEVTSTTSRDLLVPGDGSEGAQSTTTTTTEAPEVAADTGLSEETQVWLIVAALVVVALLIGVWTWRYWRRTRPVPPAEDPDPTTVFPPR